MKLTLPKPNKKKVKKVLLSMAIGSTGIAIATVLINQFFMNHYLEFRTPIIIQSPVLVVEREVIDNLPQIVENSEIEATESAKQVEITEEEDEEVSYYPSQRLIEHTNSRPDIYGKIVEHFGEDSQVIGELLARESSLNPEAINPSSGACGLPQALPCEKMACELSDVDCQLAWVDEYITNRYGTPENALEFHNQKGWY